MGVDSLGLLEAKFIPMAGFNSMKNNSFTISLHSPSWIDTAEDKARKKITKFLFKRAGGALNCAEFIIENVVLYDAFTVLPVTKLDNMNDNDLILMGAAVKFLKKMRKPSNYTYSVWNNVDGVRAVHFVGLSSLDTFIDSWHKEVPSEFDKNFGSKDEFKANIINGFGGKLK